MTSAYNLEANVTQDIFSLTDTARQWNITLSISTKITKPSADVDLELM